MYRQEGHFTRSTVTGLKISPPFIFTHGRDPTGVQVWTCSVFGHHGEYLMSLIFKMLRNRLECWRSAKYFITDINSCISALNAAIIILYSPRGENLLIFNDNHEMDIW